jgi:hypothetical protein
MTSVAGILRTVYPQSDIKRVGYRNKPFYGRVKKRTDMSGDYTAVAMRYASQLGASNDFATAQASKSGNAYAKFQVTAFEDYALGGITTKTLRMAKDKGSIVDGLKEEMEGLSYVASWRLAASLYKNGGGAIGVVGSGATGTAITLATPNDIVFFQKGQKLDGATTDGTTGSVISGGVIAVISAINRDSGIITATGGNWDAATGINGITTGNYLFSRGDFGLKLKGLDAWLPATAGGTLFGVNRDVDSSLSGNRVTAQANIEETLLWMMERTFRDGGLIDDVYLHPTDYRALTVELGSKKTYTTTTGKAFDADVGFSGIEIQGIGSKATVYPDPYCPKGVAYGLQMDTWTLWSAGDAVGVLNDDGNKMLRDATTDSIEIRMGGYSSLACDAPWMNCRATLPVTALAAPAGEGGPQLAHPLRSVRFRKETAMSSTTQRTIKGKVREETHISFMFKPNGSSAIDNTVTKGAGSKHVTVTRNNVGVFDLKVQGTYGQFMGGDVALFRASTTAGHSFQFAGLPIDNSTYQLVTLVYQVNAAGTFAPADLAADADTWVSVTLKFRNSSGTP